MQQRPTAFIIEQDTGLHMGRLQLQLRSRPEIRFGGSLIRSVNPSIMPLGSPTAVSSDGICSFFTEHFPSSFSEVSPADLSSLSVSISFSFL